MSPADGSPDWLRANQLALAAEIGAVRAALARHADQPAEPSRPAPPDIASALDQAAERLMLSSFERKIAVMCAAFELEAGFALLCSLAHGDSARAYPTFGLALAAFNDAHWSALTPGRPLRRFALIEVQQGVSLTAAALRIDEAFLHYLAGIPECDGRVAAFVAPLMRPDRMVPTQRRIADEVSRILNPGAANGCAPCIQLAGGDAHGKREAAAEAFAQLGLGAFALDAAVLHGQAHEVEARARAAERHARLRGAGLLIDVHDDVEPLEREAFTHFLDQFTMPVLVATRKPFGGGRRLTHVLDVGRPTRPEQHDLWVSSLTAALGPPADNEVPIRAEAVRRVSTQFDFGAAAIQTAVQRAGADSEGGLAEKLWRAARQTGRHELSEIAERLDDRPDWHDLVLPQDQKESLRDIIAHARNRSLVHEDWGMAERHGRGLGLSVLFHGPSGTGKTMAAEVIGAEMDLDVYRVDLSQLVSKFVGETEKNLRRVFDAAEAGGAILLFDECDAIFGRRGEVEHGQDRYANLEVSYLLQRMESYRGIAILTTNLRSAIDPAFMRRLRFVVSFPFPDYAQRINIWQRVLARRVPVERVDFHRLARLAVAGGSIRNIALHAAFLAADARRPVTMSELRRAAIAECAKLERTPSDVEIGGWA